MANRPVSKIITYHRSLQSRIHRIYRGNGIRLRLEGVGIRQRAVYFWLQRLIAAVLHHDGRQQKNGYNIFVHGCLVLVYGQFNTRYKSPEGWERVEVDAARRVISTGRMRVHFRVGAGVFGYREQVLAGDIDPHPVQDLRPADQSRGKIIGRRSWTG